MLINASLAVLTAALFLCWFRYICRLILTARTSRDYGTRFAETNHLEFPALRRRLGDADRAQMLLLVKSLHLEYQLVTALLRNSGRRVGMPVENWMLQVEYSSLRLYFRLFGSRRAVHEMCEIVAYFANAMGQISVSPDPVAI